MPCRRGDATLAEGGAHAGISGWRRRCRRKTGGGGGRRCERRRIEEEDTMEEVNMGMCDEKR